MPFFPPQERKVPCPKCNAPIKVRMVLSLENLATISMFLFTHENMLECGSCHTKYGIGMSGVQFSSINVQLLEMKETQEQNLVSLN